MLVSMIPPPPALTVRIGDEITYPDDSLGGICVAIDDVSKRCAYVRADGTFRYPRLDEVTVATRLVAPTVAPFTRLAVGKSVVIDRAHKQDRCAAICVYKSASAALFYSESDEDAPFSWMTANLINNGGVTF